jgi:hypothetical protein
MCKDDLTGSAGRLERFGRKIAPIGMDFGPSVEESMRDPSACRRSGYGQHIGVELRLCSRHRE